MTSHDRAGTAAAPDRRCTDAAAHAPRSRRPQRLDPRHRRRSASAATTTPSSGRERPGSRTSSSCARPGVNLVSVGIFSWALLEPREGEYDFALARRGARPAARRRHRRRPRHAHRRAAGLVLEGVPGGAPGDPRRRDARLRLAGHRLAEPPRVPARRRGDRRAARRALRAPPRGRHVARAQRVRRPGLRLLRRGIRRELPRLAASGATASLDALNAAWGTTFWGQRYGAWDEIDAPRQSAERRQPGAAAGLPAVQLRRAARVLRARARRDPRGTPSQPITTNFMATSCPSVDYWAWAPEVDVVSNDHYLTAARSDAHVLLAMAADLTRSLAGGQAVDAHGALDVGA